MDGKNEQIRELARKSVLQFNANRQANIYVL